MQYDCLLGRLENQELQLTVTHYSCNQQTSQGAVMLVRDVSELY